MSWLETHWIWALAAIAGALLLFRRGLRGHRLDGHVEPRGHGRSRPRAEPMGHGRRDGWHDEPAPVAAIDPVSGKTVRTATAPSIVFRGQRYYFESAGSRARFEASPERYALALCERTGRPRGYQGR